MADKPLTSAPAGLTVIPSLQISFHNFSSCIVFFPIKAPAIINVGKDIKIIAKSDDNIPVAVRHNNILGTSFHPELTRDLRIHKYFKEMIDIINPDN